jgi:hypothetical protein
VNTELSLKRDERTVAVENAAYKWGFHTFYIVLLLNCLYRHKVRNEDIGDLLLVGCVSAAVVSVYLFWHKAAVTYCPWRWRKTVTIIAVSFVAVVLVGIISVFIAMT